MSDFKRAKILVKSIRYPTFQFWAKANNKRETADRQMVIAILTLLEWLRTKFSEFSIPEEINVPEWEQYKSISMGDLKSVHINEGYTVDIINLPQQKIWALRLIEPDLSTRFENNVEISCAVPGRIFQTDIAFSIADDVFQCGVKITVSEPNVQTEPCKAYRPSLIQVLAENPLLDLRCGYPIIRKDAWRLDKAERIKQLRDYLSSGNIPAVILCDYESESKQTVPSFEGMINEIKNTSPFSRSSSSIISPNMEALLLKAQSTPKEQETKITQYDVSGLLKYRTCHAHYFRCGKGMLTEFNKILKTNMKSGDIVLIETALCGGDVKYFPKTDDPAENVSKVLYYLLDYPNGKPYNYGSVSFYADALLKQMDVLRNEQSEDSGKIELLNEEIVILKKEIDSLRLEQQTAANRHAEKVNDLQKTISDANKQIADIQSDADSRVQKAEKEKERYTKKLAYHESLSQRPQKPDGIPRWVEERFAGRLIFHKRAVNLISKVSANEVDMDLLCGALEYLASEYRDKRMGQISENEMKTICAEKYGRPYDIAPTGAGTVEFAGKDYKIKYYKGAKGKPIESVLDQHLRVGNQSENLLRIYFLYDSEKNLVVVGSLPKHLKTKTYS